MSKKEMTAREVMIKLHDKDGIVDGKELMAKTTDITGGSPKYIQTIFYEEYGPSGKNPLGRDMSSAEQTPSLTEAQLRMKHDNTYRFREALKNIKPGVYIPQAQFVRKLNLKPPYRATLDLPEFEPYHGKASGSTVYWGHPDSIKKMKEEGVLF